MKCVGKALTFDDVALVPQYNNIESRIEPNLETHLTTKTKINIPILAANMDTVISYKLADILLKNGTFPIFHRFTTIEKQIEWAYNFGKSSYLSCGVCKKSIDDITQIIKKIGDTNIRGICIDIAHGHCKRMIEVIKFFKSNYKNLEIIAGNVCTAGGYIDLATAGADAIKVGIGPGAACTTRIVTGFGVAQFSAILNCAEQARKYSVPIIADGGIRNSSDIAKALAAGACSVMIGKLFALTEESAAKKRDLLIENNSTIRQANYRGQASKDFQIQFKGSLKKGTVPEGESFWAPVSGTAQELIDDLIGGLRSAMTYGGARSIKEFQRKAEYVIVSNTYEKESNIRIL